MRWLPRCRHTPLRLQRLRLFPALPVALGYTMQVDEQERNLLSKEDLENKIATLTGGRVAEELIFHSITTGASNDIEQGHQDGPCPDHPLRHDRGL